MEVGIKVDEITDFILIFRPNLRFYKDGKIEDIINIDTIVIIEKEKTYNPDNPLKKYGLAVGSYIHFPYNVAFTSCSSLTTTIPSETRLKEVGNLNGVYKYPDIVMASNTI